MHLPSTQILLREAVQLLRCKTNDVKTVKSFSPFPRYHRLLTKCLFPARARTQISNPPKLTQGWVMCGATYHSRGCDTFVNTTILHNHMGLLLSESLCKFSADAWVLNIPFAHCRLLLSSASYQTISYKPEARWSHDSHLPCMWLVANYYVSKRYTKSRILITGQPMNSWRWLSSDQYLVLVLVPTSY